MRRRVRAEAPRRLLELALGADPVAPPGLVPRDRDMDETLEEIALGGGRGAPRELELLVRGEERAAPDQLEAVRVGLFNARHSGYLPSVATILLAGVDLFFRAKLEALLPDHHVISTDGIDPPDLVIADISRIDPGEVADAYPDVPIVGFANHADTTGLRAANNAGFDQVVVKAALQERAAQIVAELTAR